MQVGKAYFELIDYLEAEKAFRLARQASPYSLEGMDIYSTVLYVSVFFLVSKQKFPQRAPMYCKFFFNKNLIFLCST